MKQFLFILGILTLCIATNAQSDGNGPERFYNIESYKANITLTFQYQLNQSETEYSRSVNVSQTFQHFFKTGPGQIAVGDMFQIERGDKEEGKTENNDAQDGGMMEGVDMDAITKAMKNSGIETIKHKGKEVNVMDQLKKTKRETGSSDMGFDKYKMWMTTPVEGLTKTNVNTKYFQKSSSRCGEEGGITGPFTSETRYTGDANIEEGKPNVINPNGFMLLLNLNNNSYSFTCDFVMPKGFFFNGDTHESGTCSQPDKLIKTTARTFMENNKKKEGLIYKNPLPDTGMVLSGSEIITDKFGIGLDKEGANWSVKIDWTISLADR